MKINKWLEHYKEVFPVGEGWRPLVTKLCEDIIKLDPKNKIEISQVKEKFGGLRFYIWSGSEEIWQLIYKAESESLTICEICGTKENVTTEGGWILTLCKKCRKNRDK